MGHHRKSNGPTGTSRNDLKSSPQPSSARPMEWNPLIDRGKDSRDARQIVKRIEIRQTNVGNQTNESFVKRIRSFDLIVKRNNQTNE